MSLNFNGFLSCVIDQCQTTAAANVVPISVGYANSLNLSSSSQSPGVYDYLQKTFRPQATKITSHSQSVPANAHAGDESNEKVSNVQH